MCLDRICRSFGITRHAYYKHLKRSQIKNFQEQIIINVVEEIRKEQPRIGTRKLYYLLQPQLELHKIKIGRDALFNLLRKYNLLIRKRRKRIFTTNSNHPMKIYPNLIKDLKINTSNMVWVSDITYIKTIEGFIYLFLITDAYSKKIVGYWISDNLEAINAENALKMALKTETKKEQLIHHSDRGLQYCSHKYVRLLNKHQIEISMTKGGSPQENCIAERVNGILKHELFVSLDSKNMKTIRKIIIDKIAVYNEKRPHLSCNMLTPIQAHSSTKALKPLWKNYKKRQIK